MMKLTVVISAITIALFSSRVSAQPDDSFAFRDVHVVTMTDAEIAYGQTIVVRRGRIAAIGPSDSTRIPDDARIIDGNGRYLLPGLAEMHAHVPGNGDRQMLEEVLFLYAANGITTARGMLGVPAHLALREQIAAHETLGPRLITSGPSLSGQSVSTPAEARRLVQEEAEAGYDFIKLHPGLTRDEFDAAAAIADEIGIDLAGHVSADVGVGRALAAGQATIDHLDRYIEMLLRDDAPAGMDSGFFGLDLVAYVDPGRISALAAATAAAGVWIVPTQSLIEHWALAEPSADELAARPEMAYFPSAAVAQWARSKRNLVSDPGYSAARAQRLVDIRRELIREMQRQGVGLLLGSDAPQVFNVPGFSLHHELAMMVAAGLSPYEALATGTSKPAGFFGMQDEFGQVRVGLAADLILADGNPLVDVGAITRPAGVMVRGHWLDRAAIDSRLAEIARRHAR